MPLSPVMCEHSWNIFVKLRVSQELGAVTWEGKVEPLRDAKLQEGRDFIVFIVASPTPRTVPGTYNRHLTVAK